MSVPSWQDTSYGGRVRVARWLVEVVGEGNPFTKVALREAFPGVAQIDRRMRDLREAGWVIYTNREDPSLNSNEHRYVAEGEPVWLPGRGKAKEKTSLTAAQRSETIKADSYLCRSCGVGAGERFDDGRGTAQLDIARREVKLASGDTEKQLVTECNRCRVGNRGSTADLTELLRCVDALGPVERKVLAQWMDADQRTYSVLEKLWGKYRTLPADARAAVKQAVSGEGQ
ncbi:hypothetical protein OG436_18225 [Streptomyces caniferus]|uniref:hypothetical protein n=1 Tax=Streptomyces caniferus TaxID=285557 RepID=UPI002E2A6EFE|nr:hypothetical protein [Streptomyces caniferus]